MPAKHVRDSSSPCPPPLPTSRPLRPSTAAPRVLRGGHLRSTPSPMTTTNNTRATCLSIRAPCQRPIESPLSLQRIIRRAGEITILSIVSVAEETGCGRQAAVVNIIEMLSIRCLFSGASAVTGVRATLVHRGGRRPGLPCPACSPPTAWPRVRGRRSRPLRLPGAPAASVAAVRGDR